MPSSLARFFNLLANDSIGTGCSVGHYLVHVQIGYTSRNKMFLPTMRAEGIVHDDSFLPGLPVDLIRAAYLAAPGKEIESGKFASPESSSALVANSFGLFLNQPTALPPLPTLEESGWPASSVGLEVILRFPWPGGRHPCLDVVIVTETALIGVESKRFEPFRPKSKSELSEAYWRPVWGDSMQGFERIRDGLKDGLLRFSRLDVAQLLKHAFGLRTAVHEDARFLGKKPVLFYLYAEPKEWPETKKEVPTKSRIAHRTEIERLAIMTKGDEVEFYHCSYSKFLGALRASANPAVQRHAAAVAARFLP